MSSLNRKKNSRLTSPFAVPINLCACRPRSSGVKFEVHLRSNIVNRFLDLDQSDSQDPLMLFGLTWPDHHRMPAMAIPSKLLVGIAHPALLHRGILLEVLNHREHSGY